VIRLKFITLLGGVAVAWPRGALAQGVARLVLVNETTNANIRDLLPSSIVNFAVIKAAISVAYRAKCDIALELVCSRCPQFGRM
jgi:hypothetical protein